MASAIVALPVVALAGRLRLAFWFSALALAECAVLAVNRGRCPLTNLAGRYTDNRSADFDIYLPRWLAQHNKIIFGAWLLGGEAILLWKWLG